MRGTQVLGQGTQVSGQGAQVSGQGAQEPGYSMLPSTDICESSFTKKSSLTVHINYSIFSFDDFSTFKQHV